MVTRKLKVKINRENVFRQLNCREDSDVYEEFLEEYLKMEQKMYELCQSVVLIAHGISGSELLEEGIQEGTPFLITLYSIGKEISDYSTKCFSQGDYVRGMLADAMADSALFSLQDAVAPDLKAMCGQLQMGISRRVEAPKQISMKAQKLLLEQTGALQDCGVSITSGYMLDPLKSNAVVYLLTEDREIFQYQHDCRECDRHDCINRCVKN